MTFDGNMTVGELKELLNKYPDNFGVRGLCPDRTGFKVRGVKQWILNEGEGEKFEIKKDVVHIVLG